MCSGTSVRELLQWATGRIRGCLAGAPEGSADTPYLDALLLLALAGGEPTERLMASMPDPVDDPVRERFVRLVSQRCSGMPVSYIRGSKEFFGREFDVSPAVLVPRPDTETLVEATLRTIDTILHTPPGVPLHVHDCCTGSGCVALTIAAERSDVEVTASDLSSDALQVAEQNRRRIAPRVRFRQADLLHGMDRWLAEVGLPVPTIITANPPYLTDSEYEGMRSRGWPEPALALRAGPGGFDLLKRLADEAVTLLRPSGYLIVEVGRDQGRSGSDLLRSAGFASVTVHRDLGGRERVLLARGV